MKKMKIIVDPLKVVNGNYSAQEIIELAGGMISYWLMTCPNDIPLLAYCEVNYIHPIPRMHDLYVDDQLCLIHSPPDPENGVDNPLPPILIFIREDERFIIYEHAIIAYQLNGETSIISRMD